MGPSACMASANRSGSSRRVGAKNLGGRGGGGGCNTENDVLILPEYNLRPRSVQNRLETERKRYVRKEPKPKQKPPPLSKYRRKNANARERSRMTEINQAFEDLRRAVPKLPGDSQDDGSEPEGANSKLTKITTLRLAMNYIKALSQILQEQDEDATSVITINGISQSMPGPSHSTVRKTMTTTTDTDHFTSVNSESESMLLTSVGSGQSSADDVFLDVDDSHGLLSAEDVLREVLDCPLSGVLSEDSSMESSAVDSLQVSVEDFPSLLASPVSGFDVLLESDGESMPFSDNS